jgi:hypothetical protein
MQLEGYTISAWTRPDYRVDGVIVCRRAFPRADGGQYTVGEIVSRERFPTDRDLFIHWELALVDTLPAPPAAKPQQLPKAAPPRGR